MKTLDEQKIVAGIRVVIENNIKEIDSAMATIRRAAPGQDVLSSEKIVAKAQAKIDKYKAVLAQLV